MSEDENNTGSESDVLLQGASSVGSEDSAESFESLSLDSDLLRNIPVTISVEVGRTSLPIKALMQLTQGSVVELDRLAGDPLDILANGTTIAKGEVVMVGERFGIRFTEVADPEERVQNL